MSTKYLFSFYFYEYNLTFRANVFTLFISVVSNESSMIRIKTKINSSGLDDDEIT